MLILDDAGISRLMNRYASKAGWFVEVTDKEVSLYEMIGSVKCLEQRWKRVDDASGYVSIVK
jgi:hypothetical protein